VIDVSQSVEHDHPRSLEFLRMDIKNVTDFFRKKGVGTLQERTAFEFITAENMTINRDEMGLVIEKLRRDDQEKGPFDGEEVAERVFRQAYIPKNLFEVIDPERDVGIVQQGGKDDLIYSKLLDVQEPKPQNSDEQVDEHESESDEDSEEGGDETSADDSSKPRGKRHEDKDVKKVFYLKAVLTSGTKTKSQRRSSRAEKA
jgi:RIO kinase 1